MLVTVDSKSQLFSWFIHRKYGAKYTVTNSCINLNISFTITISNQALSLKPVVFPSCDGTNMHHHQLLPMCGGELHNGGECIVVCV